MNNSRMIAAALGEVDRAEMARLLREMTVGFFDHHLRGQLLTGFTPSATVRVHRAPALRANPTSL